MVAGSFAALLATGLNADLESRPDPLEGQPAPAFVLPTLSGRTLASRDLRGKVVVVNFFASWCIACRQEHAALASVWAANGRDVVVLGVAFQDSAGNVRAWRKEMGAQWPIVLDDDSRTAIDFGVALTEVDRCVAIPTLVPVRGRGYPAISVIRSIICSSAA